MILCFCTCCKASLTGTLETFGKSEMLLPCWHPPPPRTKQNKNSSNICCVWVSPSGCFISRFGCHEEGIPPSLDKRWRKSQRAAGLTVWMAIVGVSLIYNCSCQLNQRVSAWSSEAMTGVRPNAAVKLKCLNGTFLLHWCLPHLFTCT